MDAAKSGQKEILTLFCVFLEFDSLLIKHKIDESRSRFWIGASILSEHTSSFRNGTTTERNGVVEVRAVRVPEQRSKAQVVVPL